jgi:arsenate reductase
MAEGLAKMHGRDGIEAYSAGSRPAGTINANAVSVMRELAYDLTTHQSKSLNEVPDVEYDTVVTMGCGDDCQFVRAKRHIEWNIPDPKGKTVEDVRAIRDLLSKHVQELLGEVQDNPTLSCD